MDFLTFPTTLCVVWTHLGNSAAAHGNSRGHPLGCTWLGAQPGWGSPRQPPWTARSSDGGCWKAVTCPPGWCLWEDNCAPLHSGSGFVEQRQTLVGLLRVKGVLCHFLPILLGKARHKTSLDSRGGETEPPPDGGRAQLESVAAVLWAVSLSLVSIWCRKGGVRNINSALV